LARSDLGAFCRLQLVEKVRHALCNNKMVRGAIASGKLKRLTRDVVDHATTRMGEEQSIAGRDDFVVKMEENKRINTRLLLHSVVNGHVLFFADCIALTGEVPAQKVFSMLKDGSRVALNALFCQCGMNAPLRNLMARLILHAREADLSHDDAARHFVVTALIEELIIEHDGDIPESLADAFRYLDEQNMLLARAAARGVMPSFAKNIDPDHELGLREDFAQLSGQGAPDLHSSEQKLLALPAA